MVGRLTLDQLTVVRIHVPEPNIITAWELGITWLPFFCRMGCAGCGKVVVARKLSGMNAGGNPRPRMSGGAANSLDQSDMMCHMPRVVVLSQ